MTLVNNTPLLGIEQLIFSGTQEEIEILKYLSLECLEWEIPGSVQRGLGVLAKTEDNKPDWNVESA